MAGVSTSASKTASAIRPAVAARGDARTIPSDLNADALTLPPNRFSEIVQLVRYDIVDCVAGGVNVLPHLFDHIVDGNPVDQLLTTIYRGSEATLRAWASPASAFHGAVACPSRAFEPAIPSPLRTL